MYIEWAHIRNFRSIVDQKFDFKNLNVIVGNNDVGKSNLLRALNLFFENRSDHGVEFNFEEDFSLNAQVPQKKAKEIIIELHVRLPESYKGERRICWEKVWRKDGIHDGHENFYFVDNAKKKSDRKKPDRKKLFWLKNLRYKYVPAIKSKKYFSDLLIDLYQILSDTISDEIKETSKNFIDRIRKYTDELSEDLKPLIDSKLDIPKDMSGLFATLEFMTKNQYKGTQKEIPLRSRGDGIKVRHIPKILKFIADQENKLRAQGSPYISTIWGYEEPENSLELSKAFDLADEFLQYSGEIQTFITTHSPAFYNIGRDANNREKVQVFYSDHEEGSTRFETLTNFDKPDSTMGLLELIAPFIEEKNEEIRKINEKIEELKIHEDSPTLFVEGETDKHYLELAWKNLRDKVEMPFKIINSKSAAKVSHCMQACIHLQKAGKKERKVAGLFDDDECGGKYYKEINHYSENNTKTKVFKLEAPKHLQPLFRRGVKVPIEIESLFGIDIWKHAKQSSWLEERPDLISLNNFNQMNISFDKHCKNQGIEDQLLLYTKKVKQTDKLNFKEYISTIQKENIFEGFREVIKDIENYFK